MSASATVIATVPKSAAIRASAPGRAAHSRPNGSRGRKCRFRQGTKARPHSAPAVMIAAGMKRSWLEFGRGVPVKPQRVRNRPAIFASARARLPLGSLKRDVSSITRSRTADDRPQRWRARPTSHGTRSMPITVTWRSLAAATAPAAVRDAVEDGGAEMLQVRPGCDLLRPHGLGDQFRRDHRGHAGAPDRGSARRSP